jgi:transcription antitermination protein NusB
MEDSESNDTPAPKKGSRSAARLGAVQALYQITSNSEPTKLIIAQFLDQRLGQEIDGDLYAPADEALFSDIVSGVSDRVSDIDLALKACLKGTLSLARMEMLVVAILRAGAYEIIARPDMPTAVIINEYVDIAHAFYDQKEPGLVNGILDSVAKTARS